MAEAAQDSLGYIQHHLQNLVLGKLPAGYERVDAEGHVHALEESTWTIAHNYQEAKDMGFMAVHLDTLGWSIGLGVLFSSIFYVVSRKATAGVPRGWQSLIEFLVEYVDNIVKGAFHHKNAIVAPMGLTIFVWVFLMNTMDLVPVDWLPSLAMKIAGNDHFFFKVVPTTDLNGTLGIALGVFILMFFYSFKCKGPIGFLKELTSHPFNHWVFAPLNLVIELAQFLLRPCTLALRLYGNFYAGEMIFILIALLFNAGIMWAFAAGFLQLAWAIFHVIIVWLQAFLFMVLSTVYLAMAHETGEAH